MTMCPNCLHKLCDRCEPFTFDGEACRQCHRCGASATFTVWLDVFELHMEMTEWKLLLGEPAGHA